MVKKVLLALLLAVFIVACADDSTKEAKQYALEKALDDRDFDYVIRTLARADGDYSNMSIRHKYILQVAWMGRSGLNILNNLDSFFEDNVDFVTILSSVQTGSDNMTLQDIRYKRTSYYDNVTHIADMYNPTNDPNIDMAAGFAASMNVLMAMAEISLNVSGSNTVDFDKLFDAFDFNIPGMELAIDNAIDDNMLRMLNNDLAYIETVANSIEYGEDVKDKIDEYINELTDPSGNITRNSINGFLRKHSS